MPLIVDYRRTTNSSRIDVPPFHTGPIGLLPGTEIYISLKEENRDSSSEEQAKPPEAPAGVEVLIRPYKTNLDNLTRLECTMKDQRGVVGRLGNAISELGINIVSEVSSTIAGVKHHSVSMLLDWSTSEDHWRGTPSKENER